MASKRAMKVEAWLTPEEAETVRRHMDDARLRSIAEYTRACVLGGFPAKEWREDIRLGELGQAINALLVKMQEQNDADVATLVQDAKKLVRSLQLDRAKRAGTGRWE
jgi:hypothetical protein